MGPIKAVFIRGEGIDKINELVYRVIHFAGVNPIFQKLVAKIHYMAAGQSNSFANFKQKIKYY